MSETRFAARIGLDWADEKHDYCLQEAMAQTVEYGTFKHNPAAIDEWVSALQLRFDSQPVAICLELKSGPIVSCLSKHNFISLYFIPPQALANYRKVFTHSGAKDDPTDAFLQLDYLTKHSASLRKVSFDTNNTRILETLTTHRKSFIKEKVKLTNRITGALKAYYPLVLELFNDLDTFIFCDFIERWPNLSKLKIVRHDTLDNFFKTHRCGREHLIKQRIELIKVANHLTKDEAIINPYQRYTLALISSLRPMLNTIKQYDTEIFTLFEQHEDKELFNSFPGAGKTLAPSLLVAFGTDRSAFSSADEVNRYVGIAPVVVRSGKSTWTHWRYKCSKLLRQTFIDWANQTIRYSFWAREFYDKKRKSGMSHQATIRALAFKWIRVMFRCWINRTAYNEAKYLFTLSKRNKKMA